MFREIRTRERITEEDRRRLEEEERRQLEEHGYLSIKPETEMTVEECMDYWNNIFMS